MSELRTSFIETASGIAFYPYQPKTDQININDISHALSHLCRFGGHSKFFYSVAQHSILVSEYLKREGRSPLIQLYGLLHDASEGYLVDLPSPLKKGMPDYVEIEKGLQMIIWDALGIPVPSDEINKVIKDVDVLFQNYEANILLPVAAWADKSVSIKQLEIREEKMSDVRTKFLARFNELIKQTE